MKEGEGCLKVSIEGLLKLYDKEIKILLKENDGFYYIAIELDNKFLKTCRERIIEGNKKYGDDWMYKDNIKEIEFEKYDIINYLILDRLQKKLK